MEERKSRWGFGCIKGPRAASLPAYRSHSRSLFSSSSLSLSLCLCGGGRFGFRIQNNMDVGHAFEQNFESLDFSILKI